MRPGRGCSAIAEAVAAGTRGASSASSGVEEAGLGVEEFLGGEDLAVAGDELGGPVGAAESVGDATDVGRGELDGEFSGVRGGLASYGGAVGGRGEPDAVELAEGFGEEVGPGERGSLVGDLGEHDRGGVAKDPVVDVVGGAERGRGVAGEVGDPLFGLVANMRAGTVTPLGDEVAQGSEVLVLTGGEGGVLAQLDDFAGGGFAAVGGGEAGDEVILGGLDRGRALGEVVAKGFGTPSTSHLGSAERRRCSGAQVQPRSAVSWSARTPL